MITKIVGAIWLSCFSLLAMAQTKPVLSKLDSARLIKTEDLRINPKLLNPKIKLLNMPYLFSSDAVKVVVLMHGITGDVIDTDPPTTGYYTAANSTNTIKHVKAYFGYHFVLKMMGYNGSVIVNPEQARNSSNFPTIETLSGQTIRNPGDFYLKANNDNNIGDHIYRLTTANSTEKIYVMLVPRNGTIKMMQQANDAANKIVDYYNELAKITGPKLQLYLVCHSGGGVVARMIMKPDIRFDGATLDEEKAGFVRDRTVCVTTISTPHEGSPLPSKIIAIKNDASAANAAKNKLLNSIPFFRNAPDFSFPGMARNFSFVDFVTAIPTFEVRASRDNMAREFMLEFNNGEGDPKYALRSDGSKIPVYCFGGRRPTGPYYSALSQDEFGGIPQFYVRRGATVEILDKMQLMYILGIPVAHYVLHAVDAPSNDPMNWGAVPAGQAAKFDKVKWGGKTATGEFQSYAFSSTATTVLPMIYCLDGTDGETDTDGFVDYASAVGFKMGKSENEYYDHTKGGNFYRLYTGPFELHNHGTITQDQTVAQFVTDNIIRLAGPYPQMAGTTSTWTK